MAKQPNYTPEVTAQVVERYAELGNEGLETIAQEAGKSPRSVRSKLVREGVYVAPEKPVKADKDEGPTKKDLIRNLVALTGTNLVGIEGATKGALAELIVAFEGPEASTEVE